MPDPSPAETRSRRTIIDSREFSEIYRAWSSSIARATTPGEPWAIVGIKQRGAVLARRLREDLLGHGWQASDLPFGEVDISLYRDDYHLQRQKPQVLGTEIPFSVEGRRILLIDDVLFTGRTVRAAIDVTLDFGRPRKIVLAVFIDRGHRELPIAPDFTGRRIVTAPEDRVEVYYRETDGADQVELVRPAASTGFPTFG